MPVTPLQLVPALTSSLASVGIQGVRAPALAQALSQGVIASLAVARVVTAATGVSGVGTGNGRILLDPVSGIATLAATLSARGLNGYLTPGLAQGIITGIALTLNTQATVATVTPGVATGVGVGSLQGLNPATMAPLFLAGLASTGIIGPQASALASALGEGLSVWMSTGVVTTVITGVPSVPPIALVLAGTGQIF